MSHDEAIIRRGQMPLVPAGRSFAHLIDGHWLEEGGGHRHHVVNPATGETVFAYEGAGLHHVNAAANAAGRALESWSGLPAFERARILLNAAHLMRDRADTIALHLTLEQGKPLQQARNEVVGSAAVLEWFAEQGKRNNGRFAPPREYQTTQAVIPKPIGAVAVLTPWNSPLGTSVRSVAAALAAGCTAVLKPASETPRSAMGFVEALIDAGLPPGVLNFVVGKASEISSWLIDHPAIRKISFTGSVSVGRQLASLAGERLKPLVLELGGHAPVVIFDDVDVKRVAREAASAKFDNAGQICIAPSRFYVERRAYIPFLEAMQEEVDKLVVGEGWLDDVTIGPLANARRVDEIDRLVQDAISHGANLLRGGQRIGNRGCFYAPTLLSEVPDDCLLMQEEPFGPVAAVLPFDDEDEVMGRANALPFGLAGYAYSSDMGRLQRVGQRLEVGMVGLNDFNISRPELPFTGVKDSGFGYACGQEGLDGFVVHRAVTVRQASI